MTNINFKIYFDIKIYKIPTHLLNKYYCDHMLNYTSQRTSYINIRSAVYLDNHDNNNNNKFVEFNYESLSGLINDHDI